LRFWQEPIDTVGGTGDPGKSGNTYASVPSEHDVDYKIVRLTEARRRMAEEGETRRSSREPQLGALLGRKP
jgi:hypothetical protein